MNCEVVESILGAIRTSNDKNFILKCFIKLRTDLVMNREGILLFCKAGGIKVALRYLSKPNEKILELVLSILANCCVEDVGCKEVLETSVLPILLNILKSIPNNLIQQRAFRMIGNLAKNNCGQLLSTHCVATAECMQVLEETNEIEIRSMAIRAIRFLLSSSQFTKFYLQLNGMATLLKIFHDVMKRNAPAMQEEEVLIDQPGEVPKMGLKQKQHREKYFEEVARNLEGVRSDIFDNKILKSDPRPINPYTMPTEKNVLELIGEILKTLLVLSEKQINFSVWEHLNRNGATFAPVVYFGSQYNNHRALAFKILSNFSKLPNAFYMLSSADAIVVACDMLVTNANIDHPLSENEIRSSLNIICMLSTDACNRGKIRRSGALRKLISMIRETESQTEASMIFYLLNNFQYDNLSMELMLKEGLLSGLIKHLSIYLTSDEEYYRKKREEKLEKTARKRKLLDEAYEFQRKLTSKRADPIIDCDSPSSSPNSYISPSSPCSSRCMSPTSDISFKRYVSCENETYSPICSDDEDEDEDDDEEENKFCANKPANNVKEINYTDTNCGNSEIMKLLDIATRSDPIEDNLLDKDEDEDTNQDSTSALQVSNLPRSTIDIIENLLFRITLLLNKRAELGKPETMNILIKAVNVFGASNFFAGSLTNILLESQFFAQVVKQGIAHKLFLLTKAKKTSKEGYGFLETLTCVGESNYFV